MRIKEILADKVLDSRREETIRVYVKTSLGTFSASSPSGKSTGIHEAAAFPKSVSESIKILKKNSEAIREIDFEKFNDLEKVEKIVFKSEIGADTLFALEASILKALAYEQKKELWQLINPEARRFPKPVGNIIGGGMHTPLTSGKKPDFQEFLIIPKMNNFADSVSVMRKAHEIVGERLKLRGAKGILNDEGAWATSLTNEQAVMVLNETREEIESQIGIDMDIGIDVAASAFYAPDIYHYRNPEGFLASTEQINYISDLADKFEIFYIEDPVDEDDFENFKNFRVKNAGRMIVGDDLTVSSVPRFLKALKNRAIDAIILKPNQQGSLIEIKKLVYLAKKYNILTVMSHRSGETRDNTIADLAFGFQTDFIKTGVIGQERGAKLDRLIEIEKKLKK